MSRDKQIEEMAKDLRETHDYEGCEAWHCGGCSYEQYGKTHFCSDIMQAEKMTAKGYRKASEVAREIFADIEKFNRPPLPECEPVYVIKASELAELKKKYTEEGMSVCRDCIHFDACALFWYSDYDCVPSIEDSKQKRALNEACECFVPTADVEEVRHGHWESYLSPVSLSGDLYYKCSVCGAKDPYQYTTRAHPKYCPECGAKMDGERREK